ncbi:MAG: hybrid sensor histidine kinase/response regulator [Armatimonadota bacterium]|nr:hybrid sensor histidine kinase/response regulator [Armatimonadota bacterium]
MDQKPRILIIDDEEIVLDACSQILEGSGYEVATAMDGALGLRRVEELRPDVVFVDLKMPGLSGFEVLERIRALDPSIVTIVITGYATLDSAVGAMQKGAYDFLPKPFTPDEFRLVTQRGLEKRRLALEAAALRREREALRENFAAIVAHELRAPLAAVQQNLMLLAAELSGVLTEAQRARLERTKARIDDLLRMIQTWLRAFSTDIGKIREQFKPTPVTPVIAKAVESVQPYARPKDIEIVTTVVEPSSAVLGDEGALVEALVNVVGNAVKYSPASSRVQITAEERDGRVVIAVRDMGPGIPPDELPFIFGDFYRGAAGRAEEGGAGLGLAITRRIVEAHDGSITVESAPGAGSTFVISLPALRGTAGIPPPADRVLQTSPQGGAA